MLGRLDAHSNTFLELQNRVVRLEAALAASDRLVEALQPDPKGVIEQRSTEIKSFLSDYAKLMAERTTSSYTFHGTAKAPGVAFGPNYKVDNTTDSKEPQTRLSEQTQLMERDKQIESLRSELAGHAAALTQSQNQLEDAHIRLVAGQERLKEHLIFLVEQKNQLSAAEVELARVKAERSDAQSHSDAASKRGSRRAAIKII